MRRVFVVGVAFSLLALPGTIPITRFLDRTPPAPYIAREPEPPPPLGDCRLGPLDNSRPRFWSVALELDVQRAVIEGRFTWRVSRTTGEPIGLPEKFIVDDRVLPPPHETDPRTMNDACRTLPALRRSTAAGFRRMNRNPEDRVSRWLSLQVPIAYRRLPVMETEWPAFMPIDPDRVGVLRAVLPARAARVHLADHGRGHHVAGLKWAQGLAWALNAARKARRSAGPFDAASCRRRMSSWP